MFPCKSSCGSFQLHRLTAIPAWKGNYIQYRRWDDYTNPFPNFKGAAVDVQGLIGNSTSHLDDAKQLPGLILTYCQLVPKEQAAVKLKSLYKIFHSGKYIYNVVCKTLAIFSRLQSVGRSRSAGWIRWLSWWEEIPICLQREFSGQLDMTL